MTLCIRMKIVRHEMCKSWGSDVIPKDQWIDPTKKYTCGGHRVINLHIKLQNSSGQEVTYPVKGTVVLREKPWKTEYRIWSLNGKSDIVFGKGDDLVEAKTDT